MHHLNICTDKFVARTKTVASRSMVLSILKLRLRQIKREFSWLGVFYQILLPVLLLAGFVALYYAYLKGNNYLYIGGAILLVISQIHYTRKDKAFILKHIDRPIVIMGTEYALLTLLLTLPALTTDHWWVCPLLCIMSYVVAALPVSHSKATRLTALSTILSPVHFEWLSGLRRTFWLVPLLGIAAIAVSSFKIAPLIPLWLLTVTACSFYSEAEPLNMLYPYADSASVLLRVKIKNGIKMLVVALGPVLALNTVFHPDMLIVNIAFLIMQLLMLAASIVVKYAAYEPGKTLTGNNMVLSFLALSGAVPFLLPLPFIMTPVYYKKALKNLQSYFHDTDQRP